MARLALLLLLMLPGAALAESASVQPERLLSADSVLCFRFDGLDAHRAAFDHTVVGEAMKGDLGDFVDYLGSLISDSIAPAVLKQQLLEGKAPTKLRDLRKGFAHLPAALGGLGRKGVLAGLEIIALKPLPRLQLTVVLPDAGEAGRPADALAALGLVPTLAEATLREYELKGRGIHEVPTKAAPFFRVTWWREGSHLVFVAGTEGPERTLATLQGKHPSLPASPLYRSILSYRNYETAARGFIDVEPIVRLVRGASPNAGMAIDGLGLAKLRNVSGYFGFEGRNARTTLLVSRTPTATPAGSDVASRGLDFAQLPPLPRDASGIFAFRLDLGRIFDEKLDVLGRLLPGGKSAVQEMLDRYQRALGIDVRKDLLGALGSEIAVFSSPSDGPFNLGVAAAFEVKDAPRLEHALAQLFRSLPAVLGADVSVKAERYHGALVRSVHVVQQGFLFVPTFTVHDRWLAVAAFPQAVHGFVLRTRGLATAWAPDKRTQEALAAARKANPRARVLSLAVSDPRALLNRLAALGPFIAGTVDSFAPGSFDVRRLPNAQALTEPLFANVTVLTDDGNTLCRESRFALPVPLALLDPAAFIAAALDLARLP